MGRCADYILKDAADCRPCLSTRIRKKRAERIVWQYGERADSPQKRLKDKDKRRAVYYHFYTDRDWSAAQNYQICLDSGAFGIEKCAEILDALYKND